MILSTRTRFSILLAVSLTLLALWAGLFTLFSVEQFQKTAQTRLCANVLQLITDIIVPPDPDGDPATPLPSRPFTPAELIELRMILSNIRLGSTGFVGLIGLNGEFICRPEAARRPLELPSLADTRDLENIRAAATHPGIPLVTELNGRHTLYFAREIPSRNCYINIVIYNDELMTPALRLAGWLMAGFALAAVCILGGASFLIRRFTTPLRQLADYARALPESDFLHPTEGNRLLARLTEVTRDLEVRDLATSFTFMEETLRAKVTELMENIRVAERLHSELNVARDVQLSLLPRPLYAPSAPPEFALAAHLEPAQIVGGDLYDFFMLDEQRLCFAVGDVSGKGIAAALFMGVTLALLRPWARQLPDAAQLLTRINELLSRDNSRNMFVTLLVGVLDLRTGELTYANGGHNPPLIVSPRSATWLKDRSGPMVGVFPDARYTLAQARLAPGETLFLYTDGVTEAANAHGELLSDEALLQTLQAAAQSDPQRLLDSVLSALAAHVGDTPASDDVTVLALQWRPPA